MRFRVWLIYSILYPVNIMLAKIKAVYYRSRRENITQSLKRVGKKMYTRSCLAGSNLAHGKHLHALYWVVKRKFSSLFVIWHFWDAKDVFPLYCSICLAQHLPSSAFLLLCLTPITFSASLTGYVIGSWIKATLLLAEVWQYRQFINLKRANNAWCSTKLKVIVGLGLRSPEKGVVAGLIVEHITFLIF